MCHATLTQCVYIGLDGILVARTVGKVRSQLDTLGSYSLFSPMYLYKYFLHYVHTDLHVGGTSKNLIYITNVNAIKCFRLHRIAKENERENVVRI